MRNTQNTYSEAFVLCDNAQINKMPQNMGGGGGGRTSTPRDKVYFSTKNTSGFL